MSESLWERKTGAATLNRLPFYFRFRRSLDNEWRYSLRLHTPFIVSYHRQSWQEKAARFPTEKLSGNTMYCYRPNSQEEKFEVERYFEDLLPYVNDVKIKRLLIENLTMDARLDIDAYMEELSTASFEELAKTWEPRDPSKWWTMLYPTRGELFRAI